jgi:hypothetical protein
LDKFTFVGRYWGKKVGQALCGRKVSRMTLRRRNRIFRSTRRAKLRESSGFLGLSLSIGEEVVGTQFCLPSWNIVRDSSNKCWLFSLDSFAMMVMMGFPSKSLHHILGLWQKLCFGRAVTDTAAEETQCQVEVYVLVAIFVLSIEPTSVRKQILLFLVSRDAFFCLCVRASEEDVEEDRQKRS